MGHLMRPMLYSTLSPLPHSKDGGDLLQRAFRRLVLSYHSGPTCLQPISDLMSFSFLELGLLQMKTAPHGFPLSLFFLFFLFVIVVIVVVDERFSPFVLSHFSWPAVSRHPRFAGKVACLDPHMAFHSRPRERLSLRSLQSAPLLFSLRLATHSRRHFSSIPAPTARHACRTPDDAAFSSLAPSHIHQQPVSATSSHRGCRNGEGRRRGGIEAVSACQHVTAGARKRRRDRR
jgi:hypothetical protein